MAKPNKLFDELNKTNHVRLHSENNCKFCTEKICIGKINEYIKDINYIAPFEVVVHNRINDIWVSFLGKVYDLTSLVHGLRDDKCIEPLIVFAGKDLSHWFDECTGDIKHFIHPVTGVRVPYCPHGPIPNVNAQVPSTHWNKQPVDRPPWWADENYVVGYLTKRVRPLRIQNMLTREICAINVCMEDKIQRILERYQLFNSDADSYTWCYDGRVLDMTKSLDENGIPDEREKFTEVGLPDNTYVPMLLLYYNDDLKYI